MPANVSSNIPREIFVSVDVTSSAGTSEGSILSLQGDSTAQTGPSRAAEQTYLLYNVQTLWFDDVQARNTGTNAGFFASWCFVVFLVCFGLLFCFLVFCC